MLLLLTTVLGASAPGFDKPLRTEVVKLDASEKLTCTYYDAWVAKEIDAGEKGAARLSFVRYSDKNAPPACIEIAGASESIIGDWSGYFTGAIGDLALFAADDGWNGGEGFAIYDTTSAKKMFSDVAVGDLKVGATSLSYRRLVALDCNALADARCIAKAKEAAVTASDIGALCKSGYGNWIAGFANAIKEQSCDAACKEARRAQRDSFWKSSSVLAYAVTVDRTTWVVTPTKGGKVECWPAE